MILKGRAHLFGDDINTDYIIAGKYRASALDLKEMAKHVMEDIRPDFARDVALGDFIVAGKNFGCGSSREYAPKVIIEAGVSAIVAQSFARIFYRNCINSGLPVVECDISSFEEGDALELKLLEGEIVNHTKNTVVRFSKMPPFVEEVIRCGGMIEYLEQHADSFFENLNDGAEEAEEK